MTNITCGQRSWLCQNRDKENIAGAIRLVQILLDAMIADGEYSTPQVAALRNAKEQIEETFK